MIEVVTTQEEFNAAASAGADIIEIRSDADVWIRVDECSSTVGAFDSTTVVAYDSTTVVAYGSSTVEAYDSTTVVAYDSTTVVAFDSSTVVANPRVAVHLSFEPGEPQRGRGHRPHR